jgi:hypothetical protein
VYVYLCIINSKTIHNAMKYAIVDQSNPNAMRLQSIGWVLGTPSAQVKEGDFLMWNFGGVYSVNKIIGETAKTITIETSPREKPAEVYTQKLFKSRLVCILENN